MNLKLSAYLNLVELPEENKVILYSTRTGRGKVVSAHLYEFLKDGNFDFMPTELLLSLCKTEILVEAEENEQATISQRLLCCDYLVIPVELNNLEYDSIYSIIALHKSIKD